VLQQRVHKALQTRHTTLLLLLLLLLLRLRLWGLLQCRQWGQGWW
jgi:hypothetical protein